MNIYEFEEIENQDLNYLINNYDDFSIFRKKGNDSSRAVFISTILHGDEVCGLNAILNELDSNQNYNCDVYFMIGNVNAARFCERLIDVNFNRIWTQNPTSEIELKAYEIYEFLQSLNLVGILDLHSYNCSNLIQHCFTSNTDEFSINVSRKFCEFTFINRGDENLFVDLTRDICPSFIVECGSNKTTGADEFAFNTIRKFFQIFEVCNYENLNVFDISQGVFNGEVNIKFNENTSLNDVIIREDIESLNITKISAGEFFADCDNLDFFRFNELDIEKYFYVENGKVYFKKNCTINLFNNEFDRLIESGFYIYDEN